MDNFLGQIILFAGTFAPQGYLVCDGSLLSIQQYTALYSILGTTYGGNGTSNFALPDLRGRVPLGTGQGVGLSNYPLGTPAGTENVTLTTAQMPAHSHAANCSAAPGTQASPAGAYWAEGPGSVRTPSPNQYATSAGSTMASNALASAGANQAHTNIQPSLALMYLICVQGIYPPRP